MMKLLSHFRFNLSVKIFSKVKRIITKDVIFTFINTFWKIISGSVTLLCIPLFLSSEYQGFWYTFISLAALSIFADLGFTTIVTQFSSHEYAYLSYNSKNELLDGNEEYLKRIGSLLRFVVKWAITVSLIGYPIILFVGVMMFRGESSAINWTFAWLLYVLSSGLNFTMNVILSFLEGCNQISAIQKNKLVSSIVITITLLLLLYGGFNLYALAFSVFIGTCSNVIMLAYRFRKLIIQILKISKGYFVNWKKDFLRLIWRYAISWSSGYLIFQIYTPLTFHFYGAAVAGKVGISMVLISALFTVSNVWMYVSTPKLNMLSARKEWTSMDRLFTKSITLSMGTFSLGAILIFILFNNYYNIIPFMKNFLNLFPITVLLCAWFIQLIINSLAVYLRSHKQEPFMLLSLLLAIYISSSTFLLSKYMPQEYLFFGYLSAVFIGSPFAGWIFIKKRKLWHQEFVVTKSIV